MTELALATRARFSHWRVERLILMFWEACRRNLYNYFVDRPKNIKIKCNVIEQYEEIMSTIA